MAHLPTNRGGAGVGPNQQGTNAPYSDALGQRAREMTGNRPFGMLPLNTAGIGKPRYLRRRFARGLQPRRCRVRHHDNRALVGPGGAEG